MLPFEIKHTLRGLLRTPWFTFSVVSMLGVGLALVLAGFAIMQSFLLRPPPFPEPDDIMHIELENTITGNSNNSLPIHSWLDIKNNQTQLEVFAGFNEGTINMSAIGNAEDQRAERYDGVFVSADLFKVLGVQPVLGRNFEWADEQPGAIRVVMLSYQLWQHRFNASQEVLGQTVTINAESAQIIGVMPDGFRFPRDHGIWVNINTDVNDVTRGSGIVLDGLGRLRAGANQNTVQSDVQRILENINQEFPDIADNDLVSVKTLASEYVGDITRGILQAMFIAVSMVLLIACANVAGLLGARAATRSREQTIRGALGASRHRLLMTGLLEAGVLSGVAALIGVLIAKGFVGWFQYVLQTSEDSPAIWTSNIIFDFNTFIFALAITFSAALLAGWLPAWRASGLAAGSALRTGGQGSIGSGLGKVGRFLIAFEIALSLMLLVSAGLVIRSVLNIQYIEVGANVHQVMTGRVGLFETAYPENNDVYQFLKQMQLDLKQLPGASDATVASTLPMTIGGGFLVASEALADETRDRLPTANEVVIADNYLQFFEVPVLAGRSFDSRDQPDSDPVVIVSHALAAALWESSTERFVSGHALGKRLRVQTVDGSWEYRRVVGVVDEVLNDAEDLAFGTGKPISGSYYLPLTQGQGRFWSLALRSSGDVDVHQLSDGLRATIQNLDNDLPVYWLRSIDDWLDKALFDHRLIAKLFITFGLVALILTAAGLYALLAFSVANQTREIGVRRALGASASRIIRSVSHSSLMQLLVGSVFGLILAILFARLLANVLYDVSPFDPITFISVLLVFVLVTIMASAIPALRATRIQPMEALRYE